MSAPSEPSRVAPRGSLMRHLLLRLLPALLLLVAIDTLATWMLVERQSGQGWSWRDVMWVLIAGQVLLVGLFCWVLVSGLRAGLRPVQTLSETLADRADDDLTPLDTAGLPTELLPLIQHFNGMLQRLDDSVLSQKRFVEQAAHQLRTPLAGLKLESELMLKHALPANALARAERIKQATDRMIRLGQQLLVLARADAAAVPRDRFQRLDLCEWTRHGGAQWFRRAQEQGVALDMDAPSHPVWVDGDPLLLEAALNNLLDNALRYAQATRIALRVSATPPTLAVEDDGVGVDPEDREHVFDAFYRGSRNQRDGAGLGLAIVREIATAHGGWWQLTSRPEVAGTRIAMILPGPRRGTLGRRQEGEQRPLPREAAPASADVDRVIRPPAD